jgi:5-oxoprolinase (ATP-hydrolysing)
MTKGFADLLEMGDHTRPDLFDIKISGKPSLLYDRADIVEADERVTIEGYSYDPVSKSAEELVQSSVQAGEKGKVVVGLSGEAARIIKPLDEEKLEADLSNLYEKGVRGIAVCLLHSYTYPGKPDLVQPKDTWP